MAKVRHNLILQGLSGKIGSGLVIRQLPNGQTIVCAAPGPSSKPRSAAQLDGQDQFALATAYSRTVRAAPGLAAPYRAAAQRTGRRLHNLCVSDYLTLPELAALHPAGPPPAPLQVLVTNPVALRSVLIRMADADGQPLAEGPATPQPDPALWHYFPEPPPAAWAGLRVHLTLTDYPGHVVELTVLL